MLVGSNIIIDKEALFKEIVEKYKLLVTNTCYGFVHSMDDANDISQDVFVEVWKKLDFFRGDSKISTWLYKISVNKSLNFIRDHKKNAILCAIDSIKENVLAYHPSPAIEDNEEHKIKIKLLHKAIADLPKRQKTVFVLFHYEGLDYKEIAEITNATVSVVESLLYRARTNLKNKLKPVMKGIELSV